LLIIDLIDRIQAVGSDLPNQNQPIVYADPNQYSMNIVMFPIFLVWGLETWWAWLPIRTSVVGMEDEDTHARPSNASQFKKVDSKLPSITTDEVHFNLNQQGSSGEIEIEVGVRTPSKESEETFHDSN